MRNSFDNAVAPSSSVHASTDAPVGAEGGAPGTQEVNSSGFQAATLDVADVVLAPVEPLMASVENNDFALSEEATVEPFLVPDDGVAGLSNEDATTPIASSGEDLEFAVSEWLSDAAENPVGESDAPAVEKDLEFAADWLAEPSSDRPSVEWGGSEITSTYDAPTSDPWSAEDGSIVEPADFEAARADAVLVEEVAAIEPASAPEQFALSEGRNRNADASADANVTLEDLCGALPPSTDADAERRKEGAIPIQEGAFAVEENVVEDATWGANSEIESAPDFAGDEPLLHPGDMETPLLVPMPCASIAADSSSGPDESSTAVEDSCDEPILTPESVAAEASDPVPLLVPIEGDWVEGAAGSPPPSGEPAASSVEDEPLLTPNEFAPALEEVPVLAPTPDVGAPTILESILEPAVGPDETFPTSPMIAPWTSRPSIERPAARFGEVRIAAVDVLRVRLPVAAGAPRELGSRVFVKLVSEQGVVGWGEATPSGDVESTLSQCLEVAVHLRESVAPRLLGLNAWTFACYGERLLAGDPSASSRMAVGAVDMAACDLLARTAGVRLVDFFGGAESEQFAAAHVEDGDDVEGVMDRAVHASTGGGRPVLLRPRNKDVEWIVQAARATVDALPRSAAVVVDAGEGFPLDEAIRLLDGLAEAGVRCVWDPLAPAPASTYAQLVGRKRLPIALSRPLRSESNLLEFLSVSTGDLAVVDLGRLGGGRRALTLGAIAKAAGLGLVGSAGRHSALGLAHSLAVFARLGVRTFVEASALGRVLGPFRGGVADAEGVLRLPAGVGCGVEVDESALRTLG